jgi:flavin reductase (DIM6/NTAB) family NADH-FMN oxidoreductase RutF
MSGFIKINPEEIEDNIFRLIGRDWMLLSAGNVNDFNTMTASWGGAGFLWNRPVCTVYVRPQRFTYSFIEKNDCFTLSFFDEKYRDALKLCGAKSGRDTDKVKESGLTVLQSDNKSIYFAEARLMIECRKIYYQDIDPDNFIDDSIKSNYMKNDYHRMYIGEVINTLRKEKD